MINEQAAKLIFSLIPTTLSIHGSTQTIEKSLGEVPLNDVSCPTTNISFIDGYPYSRSFDDNFDLDSSTEMDMRTAIIRFKVGATDIQNNVTETITVMPFQDTYLLSDPVVQINSITGHPTSDYQLNSDRSAVVWLHNKPANNHTFVINYDWIDASYWIAHNIMTNIVQNMLGNFRILLASFGIDVIEVAHVVDISKIYANQALTVLVVDVKITYPFSWTIDFSQWADEMFTLNDLILYLKQKGNTIPDETIEIKGD